MAWLNHYQTFSSKEEMNKAVKQHLKEKWVTENDRVLFQLISRYSVKYPGAAHLKVATIAKVLGCSDKTIRRGLNRLVEQNMIKKITTIRQISGGIGANILVILPFSKDNSSSFDHRDQGKLSTREVTETLTPSKVSSPENTTETSLSLKQKNKNHIKDTVIKADVLEKSIPAPIYQAITRYFKDAASVYEYYGILLRAKASTKSSILIENHPEPFLEAWHSTILRAKMGKVKSFKNYLYGAFQQATVTATRQAKPMFNWLEQ